MDTFEKMASLVRQLEILANTLREDDFPHMNSEVLQGFLSRDIRGLRARLSQCRRDDYKKHPLSLVEAPTKVVYPKLDN